jgi:glycosyltransferase involved in cell wall biosynthesis
VLQLASGLQTHGVDVTVVFLNRYGQHPLHTSLMQRDLKAVFLDGKITSLCRSLLRERPTVLHTHGYKAGFIGRLAAKFCGVSSASTFHAGENSTGRLAFYDWLDRYSAFLAARRFAVSKQIAQRLPVTADIVDNFVNTDDLNISNGRAIAFVGRLSWEKGPDRFCALARRFPERCFHIYGGGPDTVQLRSTAPDNLRFHGQQDNMAGIWENIGLLVMPSRHEGLPMAALEAMARGIPVLAANVGALDQLIDPHLNGWLAAPGCDEELAQHLHTWLDMSTYERTQLQQAAWRKIRLRFSAQIAIPKLLAVYAQIAAHSRTWLQIATLLTQTVYSDGKK